MCSAASTFEIIRSAAKLSDRIVESANVSIAAIAEQAANTIGSMIVVDAQALISLVTFANRADPTLTLQHRLVVVFGYPVSRD